MINNKLYISLLRGINVGGHNKMPMQELRTALSEVGFHNLKTYIQSGNIIFEFPENDKNKLREAISKTIESRFGFTVPVILKTRADLIRIFNDCPFTDDKKVNSYFVLLNEFPDKENIAKASEKTYKDETYKIVNDCIYFFASNGYGRAKFNINYFEKKLNVKATARNYKTMVKLLSLSDTNN